MSDDRPRKSWRDVDRGRDRSAHRREDRPPPGETRRRERSTRTYKAALDRLFDQGGIGRLLGKEGEKTEAAGGETRLRALAGIRAAGDADEATRAVDAYRAGFGELPDDVEVWAQAVWHKDEQHALDAVRRVAALLATGAPRRTRALAGRLRYLEELAEEPELRREAAELRRRLG